MNKTPQIKLENASIVDYNRHGILAFKDLTLEQKSMIEYTKRLADNGEKFVVEVYLKHA